MNMLAEANEDHAILWNHTKAARSEYRKKQISPSYCKEKALISDEERKSNFDNLQNYLKVSNASDVIKSWPESIIEEGGRILQNLYFRFCGWIGNNCQTPIIDILSSVQRFLIVLFQENVKKYTSEEMEKESATDTPD